ncbi:MAG: M48 family metallopeptidase [Patescibacteria group bacterium]|jgi:heat shock protein HtpX
MYSQITSNKRKSVLLISLFMVLVLGLGWLIDSYYGADGSLLVVVLIYAVVTALVAYFAGDKMALMASGAKEIKKEDAPELWRVIENLCIANGQPLPKIHLIDDPAPNAFATGRTPETASVAFTTGLLARLDRTELEGVAAHELSHIKNYDIRVMTIVVVLVGVVALMSDLFFRISLHGGGGDRKRGGGIILIIGLVAIILAPLVANLVKLAISRRREFLADASGSLLTRYPEGLARALEKISSYEGQLKHAGSATAHLYIANPFGSKGFMAGLLSTHPPVEKRIEALRQMGTNA